MSQDRYSGNNAFHASQGNFLRFGAAGIAALGAAWYLTPKSDAKTEVRRNRPRSSVKKSSFKVRSQFDIISHGSNRVSPQLQAKFRLFSAAGPLIRLLDAETAHKIAIWSFSAGLYPREDMPENKALAVVSAPLSPPRPSSPILFFRIPSLSRLNAAPMGPGLPQPPGPRRWLRQGRRGHRRHPWHGFWVCGGRHRHPPPSAGKPKTKDVPPHGEPVRVLSSRGRVYRSLR